MENDLGLELLMNNKKKLPTDCVSIRSSLSHTPSQISAESVDVKEHLVAPSVHYSEEESYDESSIENESADASERAPSLRHVPPPQYNYRMSDEELLNEKKEILYQFERLERKGMTLPRRFTLSSNLEEMKMELERLKRDRELDTSIKFQRRMLMTAVSGIEFAADKFPGLGANLSGWSCSINDELDEYDDIFVELHDKYKGKAKIPAELRLMGGLAGSAFMYHLTHKWSNSVPGLDAVLKQNPELAAKLAEATRSTMNQQQDKAGSFFSGLGSMFGGMFGGMGMPPTPPPMPADMAPQRPLNKMKGPSNIDDILSELNGVNDNRVEMMSTISESEIADDVSSINGLFVNKKGNKTIDIDI